ncbi:hypothetical protein CRG98_008367 [Punica granatum]|uniref:Uncharacterized protein n=1 Tax=Punica granatum TaxID=22663 RepID=A0A2I0KRS6_PUNGR|nr:hypothetical protein CRG98_008367 [Punica granatum]
MLVRSVGILDARIMSQSVVVVVIANRDVDKSISVDLREGGRGVDPRSRRRSEVAFVWDPGCCRPNSGRLPSSSRYCRLSGRSKVSSTQMEAGSGRIQEIRSVFDFEGNRVELCLQEGNQVCEGEAGHWNRTIDGTRVWMEGGNFEIRVTSVRIV